MAELTREDIDDILKLIDGSDFDELKLEIGDLKLELRRGRAALPCPPPLAAPAGEPAFVHKQDQVPAPERKIEVSPAASAPAPLSADQGTAVPAPLLGTFYQAPKPGAAPFIQVGDTVTPETVIGIIEVMKLMNSVPAGLAGTVVEICAENGQLVEHGQTLIRVQPA